MGGAKGGEEAERKNRLIRKINSRCDGGKSSGRNITHGQETGNDSGEEGWNL